MERWKGKVAIVTGASAGIGAAISEQLVNSGLKVVGLARRKEKLDNLAKTLHGKSGKFYGIKADICNEEDILKAFNWAKENLGPIHILINNAGLGRPTSLIEGDTSDFKKVLDTNVLGLTICTREAVKDMRNNKIDGHIIHVNSVAGHYVPQVPNMNIYPASKYAVTALTETLRYELNFIGCRIKTTSISPGLVDTDIFLANGYLVDNQTVELLKMMPKLQSKDVADAVLYILGTPPHVQITELTIRPVGELP
ncbi:hypothetical protein ILUMI_01327 [Ignelater luminosus]|uniref:Farnesol dehydrogenase n=1 Tax=Ignelater luminosus TaxID=2038154 RepID=A0A8K0DIL0_IGNLU|nr:hypothetical protein ILUMI_01327 [Ignelater luminosus]